MGDKKAGWDSRAILELSGGYWAAFALHAGAELDIFTALEEEWMTAGELSERLGLSRRGSEALLNALSAMGLILREGGKFLDTGDAAKYLSRNSPDYLGFMIRHHHYISKGWAELPESVRTGKPARNPLPEGRSAGELEAFEMGMFNNASLIAPKVAESIDLSGRSSLLDLGGGPGTYAIHFCLRWPGLRAAVFDLPQVRPFAERTIEKFALGQRIGFVSGDFTRDELPKGFDAVWLSHILHGEGPESAAKIVGKASGSLNPGGMMLIHEFILDDGKDSPLHPALFSLNMLVGTGEGRSYSGEELAGFMKDASLSGIRMVDRLSLPNSRIIAGVKERG